MLIFHFQSKPLAAGDKVPVQEQSKDPALGTFVCKYFHQTSQLKEK